MMPRPPLSLALAWMTPEGAAAAATATSTSARNLLRNLLALARMTPRPPLSLALAWMASSKAERSEA
jgi:hypothetical protein